VSTAFPVAVRVLELPDEEPELDAVVVTAGVAEAVEAVAGRTAGVCAWNARTPAVPAAVAARTMGDRRIGGSRVRT
jgi:hypothetical protein